jgi:hypothetical protein
VGSCGAGGSAASLVVTPTLNGAAATGVGVVADCGGGVSSDPQAESVASAHMTAVMRINMSLSYVWQLSRKTAERRHRAVTRSLLPGVSEGERGAVRLRGAPNAINWFGRNGVLAGCLGRAPGCCVMPNNLVKFHGRALRSGCRWTKVDKAS